jgi:hypothetical protein
MNDKIDKMEVQNSNFNKLIMLNLPPIQSRYIAYQLAEINIDNFELEYKENELKIYTTDFVYKVDISKIDIPIHKIEII